MQEVRKEVEKARRQLDGEIESLDQAEEKEFGFRERLDSLREAWEASLERRSRHEVLVATIAGLAREREGLCPHLEDCTANLRAIQEIEARVDRFDPADLDRPIARLEDELIGLDCLETALQHTREARLTTKARADARGDWYTNVANTLASAIAKGECSTCERRVWSGRATIEKKRDQANAESQKLRLQSDQANAPAAEEVELSNDILRVTREVYVLQDRVSDLQYEHGYCQAAKALLRRIQSQGAKQAELEARVAEIVERLEECKRDRDAICFREDEHERLNATLSHAEVEWRSAMESTRKRRAERNRLDREYWQLVQNAMDTSAEAVGIHVEEEKVRSDLDQKMNEIWKRLTPDDNPRRPLSVSIDKDFKPTLHEHNGKGPIVSSAGLDVMVALAMRLALTSLVKEKHNSAKDFIGGGGVLILDEPFGSVDAQWRKGLFDLLKTDEWGVTQVVDITSWDRAGEKEREETVYTVNLANGEVSGVTSTVTT